MGKSVTRLEPLMKGKTHRDTKLQFMQKGINQNKDSCKWFVQLKNIAVNECFTQMSAHKGIERYGKLAITAMLKEYKQLDNLFVFGAVSPKSMSEQERRRAL